VGAVTAAAWAKWTTQRSRSKKRPDLAGLRVEQIHLAFFPIFGSLSCGCHASASQLQMQIARWDATQQTHRFPPIGIGIGGERKNAKGRVGRPAHQSEQNTASLGASRGQRFVSCPPHRKKLALFSRDGAAKTTSRLPEPTRRRRHDGNPALHGSTQNRENATIISPPGNVEETNNGPDLPLTRFVQANWSGTVPNT